MVIESADLKPKPTGAPSAPTVQPPATALEHWEEIEHRAEECISHAWRMLARYTEVRNSATAAIASIKATDAEKTVAH